MTRAMTNRERIAAILHNKPYDRIPLIHLGFWSETVQKWAREGYISQEELSLIVVDGLIKDGSDSEYSLACKLGLDESYLSFVGQKDPYWNVPLYPPFAEAVIERYEDGSYQHMTKEGVYVLKKEDATSIPAELDHTLKDRESWETHYLPRLLWTDDRIDVDILRRLAAKSDTRETFLSLYCGSLYGKLRNYWGVVEISYLQADDPALFAEAIDTVAELSYELSKHTLETGIQVDAAHFWEDICFKNGPLVNPKTFRERTGKHYRRISDLCGSYGVNIVSVDCDGYVDDLVPVWLDNGVNTMFPIEYGSWKYDFRTMRKKFGRSLLGVGNINKQVLAESRESIDHEIERIKALVDLGGFLPCLDHRIAPDAEWDLVLYFCDKMKEAFWK